MSKRMTAYWWDKDKNAVAISYKDNRLILTVDDAQALLRQLEMLLPERPSRDEPEEPGFYRTRTGAFLRKNKNGAWSALFINGDLIPRYFEELLNEGWKILRVDTMPPTELRDTAVTATNVYILEREANDD